MTNRLRDQVEQAVEDLYLCDTYGDSFNEESFVRACIEHFFSSGWTNMTQRRVKYEVARMAEHSFLNNTHTSSAIAKGY